MIDWYLEGVAFGNCNCDYGCPCQFERRPTQGNCRGFEVLRIDRGHFGDVRLEGLHTAVLYAWPGAIFEGGGTMQAAIDERADAPATGEEHRVRIDIPNGIEFELAEVGSASTKATGPVELDLDDSYGQFNVLRHSGTGVVHARPSAA